MNMRKKKEEIPKIEVIEKPHHSFCVNCTNVDMRVVKDTLNLAATVINELANELELESTSFEQRCKKLKSWVNEKKALRIRKERSNAEKTATKAVTKRHRKNKT